jgi:type IV pilus assembly protein PilO
MTAGGDFIPNDQAFDSAPNYPVVFGLQLTPTVSGILLGILGLAGAGALMYFLVLPEWEQYQQLKAKVEQTETEVQQQQATRQKIETAKKELETSKQQKQEVLTLFANSSALDTLLLDLNRQIDARNADLPKRKEQKLAKCDALVQQNVREFEEKYGELASKAELRKYEPNPAASGIIKDGSYGTQVNDKLKRQAVAVELAGNFEQTTAILQNIERLQPLLVIRGLTSALDDKVKNTTFYSGTGNFARLSPCQPDPKITTKFQLEALLPLTAEELTKVSQPTQPKK